MSATSSTTLPRARITPRAISGLALFGATAGPLVDSIHNQCLLAYDVLPIAVLLNARTSLLIPPLLAITYALLGCVLPVLVEGLIGRGTAVEPAAAAQAPMSPRARAGLAVATTILIIKLSEVLTLLPMLPAAGGVGVLLACCLLQWYVLDASWSSLLLACVVAIGGPLAELPFLGLGCWHYINPDYFPLASWGFGEEYGLNYITAPCYWAVTTDAIALGRWLGSDPEGEEGSE